MEQLVRVQKISDDGTAQVIAVRQSACSGDCHNCSGCGAVEQKLLFTARNPVGARPGQLVTVRTESGPVLAAAVVLYLLPLVLFFVGYIVAAAIGGMGALCGIAGFVLGLALAIAYDRYVVRRQRSEYTITGIKPEKGDNDLD